MQEEGRTYSVPLKATISLEFNTGEIREKEIFFGDIPLMTDRGTFIVNGAERVVVSQIPGAPESSSAMRRTSIRPHHSVPRFLAGV
jgi:DNA-directed RNA polymerase subunit beta